MQARKIVFILLTLNLLGWLVIGWSNSQISAENGWLESFQAICLLAGALIFAAVIRQSENANSRLLNAGLTLFYVNFLLRELNVRNLDLPVWAIYLLGGTGRNWALGILWAILCILLLVRREEMTGLIFSWLKSAPFIFLIIAGAFYAAGVPFDKKLFGLTDETHELVEEILEAQAALLMILAAAFSFLQRRSDKPSVE